MTEYGQLLAGCRRQDPAAFAALVEQYLPHVRAAVRRRLSARFRARFDSHDFTQNVWASFFQVTLDRLDLPTEASMVAYLTRMAEVKVAEECRNHLTLKADVRRDVSLGEVVEPATRAPTPSGLAMADDRWAALTAGLTARDRDMLRMVHDGHTHEAVAERFGLTVRTVRRMIGNLRDHQPAEDVS